jgi:hypothetical protein
MENFQLSDYLKISGLGATSGLVHHDNSLYIISDSSTFLYQYNIIEKKLLKIKLTQNAEENTPKNRKLDFESITKKNNKLYILGSGSTQNRNQQFSFNLKTKQIIHKNKTKLYQKLKEVASISDENLNLEGMFFYQKNQYLFQRGNGTNSQNGIFIKNQNYQISFKTIHLPKIQNVTYTFTDAIIHENKIFFLAAAENTESTYLDGEVLGSIIGRIDVETLNLEFTHQISDVHKFEGITFFYQTETELHFLLCEDNDTEILETIIYKLIIKK